MTSLVQDWVANPANNYGIIFGNNSSYDGLSIGTKEMPTTAPSSPGHWAATLAVWTGP